MTDTDPEPISENADEADFVDQHIEIDADAHAELDDPASVELEDDSWDADPADVADQRTPAPVDEEE